MGSVASGAILLFAVWDILLLGRLSADRLGTEAAMLVSFSGAMVLVAGSRESRSPDVRQPSVPAACLGAIAGYTGYPAWVACIGTLGLALGLAPRSPVAPGAGSLAMLVATVALAPIFEELLYRDRLLLALRARAGVPLAVVLTSLLFALPHLEAWSILGAFLVGIALGTARVFGNSITFCIAIHAGLNLASLTNGSPPQRWSLDPAWSAACGAFAGSVGVWILRERSHARGIRARPWIVT